jgi:hypothetical protein
VRVSARRHAVLERVRADLLFDLEAVLQRLADVFGENLTLFKYDVLTQGPVMGLGFKF